jgi:hypothetical protein
MSRNTGLNDFTQHSARCREKQEIVAILLEEIALLDNAIHKIKHEIFLLREYHVRLIFDVVTGKLDVRGIDLPATADTETPEEFTDLLESEEVMEDQELQEELPAEGD